jgi:hypothetical protein
MDYICYTLFTLLSLFWKNKCRLMRSPCCLCVCESPPPSNFWVSGPILMKLDMRIMAPEPIWTAYFVNPSHQSVYASPIVAGQRLGKNVTVATNTQATIKELFDTSFSMWHVSYQRKVWDQFFSELLVSVSTDLQTKKSPQGWRQYRQC